MLATLSGLAEFPERVVKLFNIREYNEEGVYSVTFYKCGLPFEGLDYNLEIIFFSDNWWLLSM